MILWNLTVLTSVGIEILQVYKQVRSVCLWSKQPTKQTTRATIPVGILLAYGQILHDRIISLSAELGSNKTCLDRHFFLKCLYIARKVCGRVYMCLVVTILTSTKTIKIRTPRFIMISQYIVFLNRILFS